VRFAPHAPRFRRHARFGCMPRTVRQRSRAENVAARRTSIDSRSASTAAPGVPQIATPHAGRRTPRTEGPTLFPQSRTRRAHDHTLCDLVRHSWARDSHAPCLPRHALQAPPHAMRLGPHALQVPSHALRLGRHVPCLGRHALSLCEHALQVEGHASPFVYHACSTASNPRRKSSHVRLGMLPTDINVACRERLS